MVIITGDKDILQLVSDRVEVYDTMKEKRFKVDEVIQRFGVKPEQVVEVMGLSGDAIDNIPGVPGIGEKTAIELIKTFGSIDNLLPIWIRFPQKRLREKLVTLWRAGEAQPATGNHPTDVPIRLPVKNLFPLPRDLKSLREIFKELEFNKLLKDLPEEKRSAKRLPSDHGQG